MRPLSILAQTQSWVRASPAPFTHKMGRQSQVFGMFRSCVTAVLLTSRRYCWPTLLYLNICYIFNYKCSHSGESGRGGGAVNKVLLFEINIRLYTFIGHFVYVTSV